MIVYEIDGDFPEGVEGSVYVRNKAEALKIGRELESERRPYRITQHNVAAKTKEDILDLLNHTGFSLARVEVKNLLASVGGRVKHWTHRFLIKVTILATAYWTLRILQGVV